MMADNEVAVVEQSPAGGELAEIQQTLRESPKEYWRDRDMQERHLNLLSQGGSPAQARRPAAKATAADERREIERLMGDTKSAYWKGPDAARLQARHLELIEGDMGRQAPASSEPPVLPIPADATALEIAAAHTAQNVLIALPSSSASSLEASFNSLPREVIGACRDELAAQRPYFVQPVTDEFLDRFAASPRGRVLVPEWGAFASTRLGRISARMDRWMGRMPDEVRDAAARWLKALPVDQACAVFRVLSN